MIKVVQITDCHLCLPGQQLYGLDPTERLRQVVQSINLNHVDANLCVLTGDLADQGEVVAYQELRNCLAELSIEFRIIPGNHDNRANMLSVFPNTPVDANGFVQSVLDFDSVALIFLDTLNQEHPAVGLLCTRRISWLQEQLEQRKDKRIFLFMHHPPLTIGIHWFEQMLLSNGEDFMAIIKAYPWVEHITFGHVHMKTSGCWRGVSYSSSRGTCHKIPPMPDSRYAVFVESAPAYDLLLIDNFGIAVHSVDPAGPNTLLAMEYPTADGRGCIELPPPNNNTKWL